MVAPSSSDTEHLDAIQRHVPRDDGITREPAQERQPLMLARALAPPPRPPHERALPVVPAQLAARLFSEHNAAIAQADGARDIVEEVLFRSRNRPDLDQGLVTDRPALTGSPERGQCGGDRDVGGIGSCREGRLGGGVAGGRHQRKEGQKADAGGWPGVHGVHWGGIFRVCGCGGPEYSARAIMAPRSPPTDRRPRCARPVRRASAAAPSPGPLQSRQGVPGVTAGRDQYRMVLHQVDVGEVPASLFVREAHGPLPVGSVRP